MRVQGAYQVNGGRWRSNTRAIAKPRLEQNTLMASLGVLELSKNVLKIAPTPATALPSRCQRSQIFDRRDLTSGHEAPDLFKSHSMASADDHATTPPFTQQLGSCPQYNAAYR